MDCRTEIFLVRIQTIFLKVGGGGGEGGVEEENKNAREGPDTILFTCIKFTIIT